MGWGLKHGRRGGRGGGGLEERGITLTDGPTTEEVSSSESRPEPFGLSLAKNVVGRVPVAVLQLSYRSGLCPCRGRTRLAELTAHRTMRATRLTAFISYRARACCQSIPPPRPTLLETLSKTNLSPWGLRPDVLQRCRGPIRVSAGGRRGVRVLSIEEKANGFLSRGLYHQCIVVKRVTNEPSRIHSYMLCVQPVVSPPARA